MMALVCWLVLAWMALACWLVFAMMALACWLVLAMVALACWLVLAMMAFVCWVVLAVLALACWLYVGARHVGFMLVLGMLLALVMSAQAVDYDGVGLLAGVGLDDGVGLLAGVGYDGVGLAVLESLVLVLLILTLSRQSDHRNQTISRSSTKCRTAEYRETQPSGGKQNTLKQSKMAENITP
jgi:hypothetical protein